MRMDCCSGHQHDRIRSLRRRATPTHGSRPPISSITSETRTKRGHQLVRAYVVLVVVVVVFVVVEQLFLLRS